MKKKILLALTLVAVFVCLFAISISAEDMTQYVEFKVQLEGADEYIPVYQPNTKNNPELHFSNDFFTKLDKSEKIEDKTTIVKIDLSDAKAVGVNNSYIGVLGAGTGSDFINVTEIKFPNRAGFTTIGQKFCMGWTSLETVDFGCATTIKNNAFNGCTSLKEITVPANVTYIETNLCDGCTGLTKATILGNAELLSSAFKGCTSLTEVSIENVKYISSSAFYGCTSLTSITIPANATKIDKEAFYNTGITSITIPATVASIGEKAFSGCTSLTSVTFEPNSELTSIGSSAFYNCSSLSNFTILSGVTSIGSSAFNGCKVLTKVHIPASVTSIGSDCWRNCSGITSITFDPNCQVTKLYAHTFDGTAITEITIPNTVTSIGQNCFACSKLTTVNLGAAFTDFNASNATQAPLTGASLEFVYLSSTFTADNVRNSIFMWNDNHENDLKSNKLNLKIIFTGTKEQAEAIINKAKTGGEGGTQLNGILASMTILSYNEYLAKVADGTLVTGVKNAPARYFIYGYSQCDAFYNGEHRQAETTYGFAGAEYFTAYQSTTGCDRCVDKDVVDIANALFTYKGFSTDGNSIVYDIRINKDAIKAYNNATGKEIKYGIVASQIFNDGALLNNEGAIVDNRVVAAEFSSFDYTILQIKILNVAEDLKTTPIHCCAYIVDGSKVKYLYDTKDAEGKAVPNAFDVANQVTYTQANGQ